jgi:hypothetical protein
MCAKVGLNPRNDTRVIRAVRIEQHSSGRLRQAAKRVVGNIRPQGVPIPDGVYKGAALLKLLQRGSKVVRAAGIVAIRENQQCFISAAAEFEMGGRKDCIPQCGATAGGTFAPVRAFQCPAGYAQRFPTGRCQYPVAQPIRTRANLRLEDDPVTDGYYKGAIPPVNDPRQQLRNRTILFGNTIPLAIELSQRYALSHSRLT